VYNWFIVVCFRIGLKAWVGKHTLTDRTTGAVHFVDLLIRVYEHQPLIIIQTVSQLQMLICRFVFVLFEHWTKV